MAESSGSPGPDWIAASPSAPRNDGGLFAEAALRLAGMAGALLGWRAEEFWRSTPAELAAVLGAMAPAAEAGVSGEDLARLVGMFPDRIPALSPRT